MVNSLNCIEDSFTTTDRIGGGSIYTAETPILLQGCQYRWAITEYTGLYLTNCHIDGRNSDDESWSVLARLWGIGQVVFQSDNDFLQVRIFWNKTQEEKYTDISFWVRPDNSIQN